MPITTLPLSEFSIEVEPINPANGRYAIRFTAPNRREPVLKCRVDVSEFRIERLYSSTFDAVAISRLDNEPKQRILNTVFNTGAE